MSGARHCRDESGQGGVAQVRRRTRGRAAGCWRILDGLAGAGRNGRNHEWTRMNTNPEWYIVDRSQRRPVTGAMQLRDEGLIPIARSIYVLTADAADIADS